MLGDRELVPNAQAALFSPGFKEGSFGVMATA
jgi:hypothetical protein